MADVVDKETRSRMMSGIRGQNTKPELVIRNLLHSHGFRYRLHVKELPGKPDIVLPRHRAVIFINGCFWHGHGCDLFKWPTSNVNFWRCKIEKTALNDFNNIDALLRLGWRVAIIWECALKGKNRISQSSLYRGLELWILSDLNFLVLPCHQVADQE